MATMYASTEDSALIVDLRKGAVGILPTDTVYGLVCVASDRDAVERFYASKQRESKAGIIIASTVEQLLQLGVNRSYIRAVQHFWPNAISVRVPSNARLQYLDNGVGTLALRVPSDERMQKLLAQTGPLLTTSANQPDEPTAVNVVEAIAYFGDSVDFYVDGGDFSGRPASTLIRIVDDAVEVLRPGSVEISESGQIIQADHS